MKIKITVSEAARILKVHPETVRRLNRKGVLLAQRDYRGFRVFSMEDLLRLKVKRERLA